MIFGDINDVSVSVSVFFWRKKLGEIAEFQGVENGALGFIGHVRRRRRTRRRSATPCVARGLASPPGSGWEGVNGLNVGTQPIPTNPSDFFWGWYLPIPIPVFFFWVDILGDEDHGSWWVASLNFLGSFFGFLDGSVSVRKCFWGVRLFQERLLSEKTFDLAFIMLGTNDLASGEDMKQFTLLQSNFSGRSPATDHTVSRHKKDTKSDLSIFEWDFYHDFTKFMCLPWFYHEFTMVLLIATWGSMLFHVVSTMTSHCSNWRMRRPSTPSRRSTRHGG